MLVISVRPRGYVQVGPDIRIYNPNDETIRVGFEAPRDVQIVRGDAKVKQPKKP